MCTWGDHNELIGFKKGQRLLQCSNDLVKVQIMVEKAKPTVTDSTMVLVLLIVAAT